MIITFQIILQTFTKNTIFNGFYKNACKIQITVFWVYNIIHLSGINIYSAFRDFTTNPDYLLNIPRQTVY